MTNPNFDKDIERAIKFLVFAIHKSGNNPKPVILHSIRVGLYLNNLGYGKNIILAAILHDIIEDSETSLEEIKQQFGQEVASIVEANSFDKTVADKTERYKEAFNRCLKKGKDALIIKAADILDNSNYYHLAEDEKIVKWLLEKMKYFLELSSKNLKGQIVWDELQKQYKVAKESPL
jgi:(p)ppGpp synthase/HD superfamily hydrolase